MTGPIGGAAQTTSTPRNRAGVRIHYWIDHACEFEENNGIQRVCRYLARGLEERGEQLVFRKWSDRKHRSTLCSRRQLRKFSRWHGPRLRNGSTPIGPERWLDLTRTLKLGEWILVPDTTYGRTTKFGGHETRGADLSSALIDYTHSRGAKIAFIFYDLLPIETPDDPLRVLHEQRTAALAHADLILPISRYAAQELTRYFRHTLNIPRELMPRIVTCPLAEEYVGWTRVTVAAPPVVSPIEILCVSTISPRKNQLRLLEAFEAFCRDHPGTDVHLTLAGHYYPPASDAVERAARSNPRVTLAGFLADHDVVDAYRRAHFSVFPSYAEGYGLPVVESLWFGKPSLCANFGPMAEIAAGGGCLTVDTTSVPAIKDGLAQLIFDEPLRKRLAAEAISRPMQTWHEYAGSVLAALNA